MNQIKLCIRCGQKTPMARQWCVNCNCMTFHYPIHEPQKPIKIKPLFVGDSDHEKDDRIL